MTFDPEDRVSEADIHVTDEFPDRVSTLVPYFQPNEFGSAMIMNATMRIIATMAQKRIRFQSAPPSAARPLSCGRLHLPYQPSKAVANRLSTNDNEIQS
jgi:hypothetical protein